MLNSHTAKPHAPGTEVDSPLVSNNPDRTPLCDTLDEKERHITQVSSALGCTRSSGDGSTTYSARIRSERRPWVLFCRF